MVTNWENGTVGKKVMSLLATAVLILTAFSACSTEKPQEKESSSKTQQSEKKEEQSARASEETGSEATTASSTNKRGVPQTKKAETQAETTQADQQVNAAAKEALVQLYCTAYNKTKAAGKLKGKDSMTIVTGTLKMNDKKNKLVETMINEAVQHIFKCNDQWELPPAGAQFAQSPLRSEDIKIASCKENDTQWVLKLIPQDAGIPQRGKGGSGNFIEVISIVDLKQLATDYGVNFAQGRSFDDCVTLDYLGAESTITIDKASGLITSAIYRSVVHARATHVNVAVFKDQTACATVAYEMQYPSNEQGKGKEK